MILDQMVDSFLSEIRYSSQIIYENKIKNFIEYIKTEKDISDNNYKDILEAVTLNDIGDSLDNYISKNKIKKKTIGWHFASVVKQYFDYLYANQVKNHKLIKTFGLSRKNPASYQYFINSRIQNNPNIGDKESMTVLTKDEIDVLIAESNQKIKGIMEKEDINRFRYNNLMASIIIKLIIYTGVTYKCIRNIELCNFSSPNETLMINGFEIRLPKILANQIRYYNEVKIGMNLKGKHLFIRHSGSRLVKQTNIIKERIFEFSGRYDVTGIIKYAIIDMLKTDANQRMVEAFTGAGVNIIRDCQQIVLGEILGKNMCYLDNKLQSRIVFKEL